MTTSFDTNISNYTLAELMAIVELNDLNTSNIIKNTNFYIKKYKTKKPLFALFFK